MTFPADYHINDSPCTDNWKLHQWSTMGHPLTHQCNTCHKPKWVHNKRENHVTSPQHAQLFEVPKL